MPRSARAWTGDSRPQESGVRAHNETLQVRRQRKAYRLRLHAVRGSQAVEPLHEPAADPPDVADPVDAPQLPGERQREVAHQGRNAGIARA